MHIWCELFYFFRHQLGDSAEHLIVVYFNLLYVSIVVVFHYLANNNIFSNGVGDEVNAVLFLIKEIGGSPHSHRKWINVTFAGILRSLVLLLFISLRKLTRFLFLMHFFFSNSIYFFDKRLCNTIYRANTMQRISSISLCYYESNDIFFCSFDFMERWLCLHCIHSEEMKRRKKKLCDFPIRLNWSNSRWMH